MKKPVRVGICGLGTVGSGVVNLLRGSAEVVAGHMGTTIEIVLIGARRDNPACDTSELKVSRDIFDVVRSSEIDVVVELIGGTDTAKELTVQAMRAGKHVVTANKALIAEQGNMLASEAQRNGVMLNFEAAVAAGIPVLQSLKDSLVANDIQEISGIINGTSNYILSAMTTDGVSFKKALADAKTHGYAEADPTFDIEGIDAAHKIAILASMAFGIPIDFNSVRCEGITSLEQDDIVYARNLGYTIKHIGVARKVRQDNEVAYEIRVYPALVHQSSLLSYVHGVTNAIEIVAQPVGKILFTGAGAGAEATASAIVADIVNIARYGMLEQSFRPPILAFHEHMITKHHVIATDDIESAWYFRLKVMDRPGVMASIATIFADEGISLEAITQQEPQKDNHSDNNQVSLVLITHSASEHRTARAQTKLEDLDSLRGRIQKIRLLSAR